jgi:hypothetical protein
MQGIVCIRQRWEFHYFRIAGTTDHPNTLSMWILLCMPPVLTVIRSPISKRLRLWCAAACALGALCLVLTISRGGMLTGFGIAVLSVVVCGVPKIDRRSTPAIIGTIVTFIWLVARAARDMAGRAEAQGFQSMWQMIQADTQEGGDRAAYWEIANAILHDFPFFGTGLNTWSYYAGMHYRPLLGLAAASEADPPAHTLIGLTAGECGILGLVAFSITWVAWPMLTVRHVLSRSGTVHARFGQGVLLALIGLFTQSLSEWCVRQTPIYLMLNILLGAAAATRTAIPRKRLFV